MKPFVAGGGLGSVLLLSVAQDSMKIPEAGPLAAYIQTSQDGAYVDWLEGHVSVKGTAMVYRRIAQNKGFYAQAKTDATIQGQDRMLPLIAQIPRDGRTLLGSDAELKTKIHDRVTQEKPIEVLRDTGPVFEVLLKTPLWGADSLMNMVLGEPGPARIPQEVTTAGLPVIPARPQSEAPTGLIVDARGLEGASAAMLPRILDEKGHLIHGLDSADSAAVRDRGLVAYAIAPFGVEPLSAGQRQGDRPMLVKAVSSAGATHADLVISQSDADRVAATTSSAEFLKQCHVIILLKPQAPPKPRVAPH